MKQEIKSGIRLAKRGIAAGLASVLMSCASMVHYVEPKVGAIIPVAAEKQSYGASFSAGADYGFYLQRIGLGLEAGLDYFQSSAQYVTTDSLLPRVALNFSPFEIFLPNSIVKPYLSGGASFLNEFAVIDIPEFDYHENVRSAVWGIDAGLGITLFDRFNVRAGYTFLPTSENVKGIVSVSGGYRFLLEGKK